MELHRVRSLTESEKASREKAVRPPMHSLASYYSSGSSSMAGMSDTEDDEEESWQDALEQRSSSRSSVILAGSADGRQVSADTSNRNEYTQREDQGENAEDDGDSDLEPDHFRAAVQNSSSRKTPGHVAHGSVALDGVDIEALIASYRPLIHPAVAAHIDERHANIVKGTTIVRGTSSPIASSSFPSPASSRPTSSSSSSIVASSSKDSLASAKPNTISRKTSSTSFRSLFSRNAGSSNRLQKEKSKQGDNGKWVAGELPIYDEERISELPPHMRRTASATMAGSSLSHSTHIYATSSAPRTAASQQLQHRSFSNNDVQSSRASRSSSHSKKGGISTGDSPRSSLSSSSTGTTARSSTSARSGGSFRWSVDSSASNATTKTSTSVPASHSSHHNFSKQAAEKQETIFAGHYVAEGAASTSRRGSRHGHTVSIDSLDDFDAQSVSSKDFPAPPPLSRKNSTASSVFSLPSSCATRPRNDSITSTTSASGRSQALPFANVIRSSPLSPGLSTATQASNTFFTQRRKDSDTASIRSHASAASNLALPVHRVAPLRKSPSTAPESTQIRQRQASAPIITTSSSSMSSTAILPPLSTSSTSGSSILRRDSAPLVSPSLSILTSSAMSASSSLPHEAYNYQQDYIPLTSDKRPQTQTLYRPPPQQQVLSSYKPSSGRPAIRRDATYPTYS